MRISDWSSDVCSSDLQAGIAKLIALFPDKRCTDVERDEYNRAMKDLAEDIRDFVILHFHATRRDDSPFWDYCRTMEPPDSLARKIALFREKGRVFRDNFELFSTPSWEIGRETYGERVCQYV